ncbi:hypothetical protein [Streptomyces sp. NBC_00470]|uniref:hypothetical protein n=1 Tax=Streptomyces sp. NBC_00470 TaxID=2975753 RepID=UPI0032558EA8
MSNPDLAPLVHRLTEIAAATEQHGPGSTLSPADARELLQLCTAATNGPVHQYFSATNSNYVVRHRTLMQSMTLEWQERMVTCLQELDNAYTHLTMPKAFKVTAATEHTVGDLTDTQLPAAGVTVDWYAGETPPEDLDLTELGEWQAEHARATPVYYRTDELREIREIDEHTKVLLPLPDPVPAYDQGRTYLPPHIDDASPGEPGETDTGAGDGTGEAAEATEEEQCDALAQQLVEIGVPAKSWNTGSQCYAVYVQLNATDNLVMTPWPDWCWALERDNTQVYTGHWGTRDMRVVAGRVKALITGLGTIITD